MLDTYVFNTISTGQVMVNATTANSTNVIDLGALVQIYSVDAGTATALAQFGPTDRMFLKAVVITAASAGTSLIVALQDCATEGGTYQATDLTSPTITRASGGLAAGKTLICAPLPRRLRRYLRLLFTCDGDVSTCYVAAWLEWGTRTENDAMFRG